MGDIEDVKQQNEKKNYQHHEMQITVILNCIKRNLFRFLKIRNKKKTECIKKIINFKN